MPTYQYRCTNCGRELEVVQKFSDPSLTECPECAGALKKVFNAVGVVFKGSGFYRTDSRNGNGSSIAASDKGSSEKGSSSESGSSSSDKGSSEKKSSDSSASSSASSTSSSTSSSSAPAKAGASS